MSIFITPASRKATAQATNKQFTVTLVLVLVVMCLSSLVLAITSEPFAHAVELMGVASEN